MRTPYRRLAALSLALLLCGCATRSKEANSELRDPPPWAVDRLSVKQQLARDLIAQGNTQLALDVIRDLRANDDIKDPELDLLQGIALRDEGLLSEAERLLESARAKMPRNAEVYEALCVLHADAQRAEAAIEGCRRATKLDPQRASAWNNLGFLLLAADLPQEALPALEKAVDINSSETRYRNNLALAQAGVGRARDALRTFMSTSSRPNAHFNVATALERFGRPEEALEHYDQALKLDPNLETARHAVARLRPAQEN